MLGKFIQTRNIGVRIFLNWQEKQSFGNFTCLHVKRKLSDMVNVLNVAEKNSVAKNVAQILGRGAIQTRETGSVYNKLYEFRVYVPSLQNQCLMKMTSVSGHLLSFDFGPEHRKWTSCNPQELFSSPIVRFVPETGMKIKKCLQREIRNCSVLIIWTDCDREGENIGFEIIDVCREVKPNLKILRAHFSEITGPAINRALNTLTEPNKKVSDAVDVRQKLDLRIGAAFTRFLTMGLQVPNNNNNNSDKNNQIISYGSCQFPTLGFVVERWKQREEFVPQPFWYITVESVKDGISCSWNWKRQRLFDERSCIAILSKISEHPTAKVTKINSKQKSKYRPYAMDTVTFERLASSKLRINAKRAMMCAEKLYTSGYISYPRTETNKFPPEIKLNDLVTAQQSSSEWGQFANRIIQNGGATPRNGNKSDQAHPPIHPTKYASNLNGDEKKIYELIVRHFLACCDKDAQGFEVTVQIEINEEIFTLKGLQIKERNYLEVYIYEKWYDKEIPQFVENEMFVPNDIDMKKSETTAPELLTEAQLIALMEKHGIGTDATHADHIEKIKERGYIMVTPTRHLMPKGLGIGLVEAYDDIGFEMSKPYLRAALEKDLVQICEGTKTPEHVLKTHINEYEKVYKESHKQKNRLFELVRTKINS